MSRLILIEHSLIFSSSKGLIFQAHNYAYIAVGNDGYHYYHHHHRVTYTWIGCNNYKIRGFGSVFQLYFNCFVFSWRIFFFFIYMYNRKLFYSRARSYKITGCSQDLQCLEHTNHFLFSYSVNVPFFRRTMRVFVCRCMYFDVY